MLDLRHPTALGLGTFGFFAVLAGLTLLVAADHSSPGCTGPRVQRCDYVVTAKTAITQHAYRRFSPDLGFELIDVGSSVRVQQFLPEGQVGLFEGPSVLIDKRSCRVCAIEARVPSEPQSRAQIERVSSASAQDVVVARGAD